MADSATCLIVVVIIVLGIIVLASLGGQNHVERRVEEDSDEPDPGAIVDYLEWSERQ